MPSEQEYTASFVCICRGLSHWSFICDLPLWPKSTERVNLLHLFLWWHGSRQEKVYYVFLEPETIKEDGDVDHTNTNARTKETEKIQNKILSLSSLSPSPSPSPSNSPSPYSASANSSPSPFLSSCIYFVLPWLKQRESGSKRSSHLSTHSHLYTYTDPTHTL